MSNSTTTTPSGGLVSKIKIVNSSRHGVDTVHFHMKHYKATGLSFMEYFMVLLYEEKNDWSVKELEDILNVTDRTVQRMRNSLVGQGYLIKGERRSQDTRIYLLTGKGY